jgi:hypothetical protein
MARYSGSIRPFRAARRAPHAKTPSTRLRLDRGRRLRWAGYAVLLAGAVLTGLITWNHVYYATPSIEELLPASSRAHRRQMGILYGSVGGMAVDLEEALRRPGTQVALVLTACAVVAGVCFRVARSTGEDED